MVAVPVLLLAAAGSWAMPYVNAAAFIARAADLPGAPGAFAAWRDQPAAPVVDLVVPTRNGGVPGRIYRPATPFSRTVVLVPGVHTVSFAAVGYQPRDVEIRVEAGSESERKITLEPVPVVIQVEDTVEPEPVKLVERAAGPSRAGT